MTELVTTNGFKFQIDDEDTELASGYSWRSIGKGYIYGAVKVGYKGMQHGIKRHKKVALHRLLMGFPIGKDVDHRDMNRANNQKENLRVASRSSNMANSRSRGGTSRYKGVLYHKQRGYKQWTAKIMVDESPVFLGNYVTEGEAALAYNEAAIRYFHEFALLNEVDPDDCIPPEKDRFVNIPKTNTSGYRGVYKNHSGGWVAETKSKGKKIYLGVFDNPEDAAAAYNKYVINAFGASARINRIPSVASA